VAVGRIESAEIPIIKSVFIALLPQAFFGLGDIGWFNIIDKFLAAIYRPFETLLGCACPPSYRRCIILLDSVAREKAAGAIIS